MSVLSWLGLAILSFLALILSVGIASQNSISAVDSSREPIIASYKSHYVRLTTGDNWIELTVNSGRGGGNYTVGSFVRVSADEPPRGQRFAGWTGDIAILANPLMATTTAIVPPMAVAITATYSAVEVGD